MKKNNPDFIYDDFISDLDHIYSADVTCCENCFNHFEENWPNIVRHSDDFVVIDFKNFYEKSRLLREFYDYDFLDKYSHKLTCKRCGCSIVNSRFWIGGFHFSLPSNFEEFESDLIELKSDIEKTPYLGLKNDLAKDVYDIILDQYHKTEPTKIDYPLFRGRKITTIESKEDFLPPKAEFTNEGRFNHKGIPVAYLANEENTCYNELRKPEDNFFVAKFELNNEFKLLDLNDRDSFDDKSDLLKAIMFSSVAGSKANDEDTYKPEYYFTRYISDCCRKAGFDGIIYPSIQIGKGVNYVFFDTDSFSVEQITSYRKYKHSNF